MIQRVIASNRLRPESYMVQGCRAPDVVHGGMRIVELGQAPDPTHQIPNELPCPLAGRNDPNLKFETKSVLVIGDWDLFGIWILVFGV